MNVIKNNWLMIVALVVILTGLYLVEDAQSGHSDPARSHSTTQPATQAPMAVYQPPSAKQVADSLGCKKFKDHGPSEIGGSTDSGACWIGKVKYAINTFSSLAVRDTWLQSAEPLGVVPKWETDTSVTYKSVA